MNFISKLPRPSFTRFKNKNVFEWMNIHAPGKKILNLGSGVGNFDYLLRDDLTLVNVDISIDKPQIDIQADAHFLPFIDNSFDIVYSIAVLEHVKRPWDVAAEITRVLKPGGHVLLDLPFLNVIHDTEDYFRFTDKGIISLFGEEYRTIDHGVSAGGASFLSVFLLFYFKQFIPTSPLKFIWLALLYYPVSLLKFIDIIPSKESECRVTANSFFFIGQKK